MLSQIELLKKYDLKIRGHLGQHLLMDPNTIRKIVDSLGLQSGDRVFEIGPGLGAVTREILGRGYPVIAVEKDKRFVEVLNQELDPVYGKSFRLVHADVLKTDLTKMLEAGQKKGSHFSVKVIGNLPYYISTPILFHLIEHAKIFSRAVLMLQKEVACRLLAQPGEVDYSRLSVTSRLYGETRFLFDVSPACFLPHPKVMSRVISYTLHPSPVVRRPQDLSLLLEVIRIAFSQRRKTLLALLAHQWKPRCSRVKLELVFQELGLSPQVRGEMLSLANFSALAEALHT